MSMSISTPISHAGMQPQVPTPDASQGKSFHNSGSFSSLFAAIANAQHILGVRAYEENTEEMKQSMEGWRSGLQAECKAVAASCKADRAASSFRFWTRLAASSISVFAGLTQLGGTLKAGTQFKKGYDTDAPAREKLKQAKTASEAATTDEARSQAQQNIELARTEMKDMRSQAEFHQKRGDTVRSFTECARFVDQGVGGAANSFGESKATDYDIEKKYQDLSGKMSSSNAQLDIELARRRTNDASESRKRNDETNQALTEFSRAATRGFV